MSLAFELTAETESLIAQICARLDHLPLAIELAAGAATLSLPTLFDRLARNLGALRTVERHIENVYAKLGVHGRAARAAVTAHAARTGLLPDA